MAKRTNFGQEYYKSMKSLSEGGSADQSFFKKALTYDTPTAGKEFMPTDYSAQIILQVYEREWHRQAIPSWVMSALKEKIPKFSDMAVGKYLASDITSLDPDDQIARTTRATTDVEIELKTLTMNLPVSNKFLAYNASPQVESVLRETLISEMIETEVDVLINGDTTASHMDADVTESDDRRKAFSGLRKLAGSTHNVGNKAFSVAVVNTLQEKLGRYGRGKVNELLLLASPSVARQLRNAQQLQTLDKYGSQATILTGETGKVNGISVIETDFVRSDLNASGVYDNVTKDRTMAILFNPNFTMWGVPSIADRTLSVKVWDDPRFDRKQLILVEDLGFAVAHSGAIVVAYNINKSAEADDEDES